MVSIERALKGEESGTYDELLGLSGDGLPEDDLRGDGAVDAAVLLDRVVAVLAVLREHDHDETRLRRHLLPHHVHDRLRSVVGQAHHARRWKVHSHRIHHLQGVIDRLIESVQD